MGLTAASTGHRLQKTAAPADYDISVILSGNPNVGKSSVFNLLTKMHQHTGNWSGKTVETACGVFTYSGKKILVTDIPGCYSLDTRSPEEDVAKKSILSTENSINIVICDASLLCRNLNLFFQVAEVAEKVILCVNLTDEAAKKGITVDYNLLSRRLKVPVIPTCAKSGKGTEELKAEILKAADLTICNPYYGYGFTCAEERLKKAEEICSGAVIKSERARSKTLKADKLITSKYFGLPFMFLMLLFLFWLTITAANYPSAMLSKLSGMLEAPLYLLLTKLSLPKFICNLAVFGIYRTLMFIVSVMLPPMAIFFPLFTLAEDLGLLPRIAFNMDSCFKKCNTCGKQCLTMCMGLGCNAAGVVGCRIIDSKRERLIAIITNSLVPCNGRFPTLITMITLFFAAGRKDFLSGVLGAAILSGFILLSVGATFLSSYFLSKTVLRGAPSSFSLELPPYRKPKIAETLLRSLTDRILFVLSRAVIAAVPAGAIIFLAANINFGGASLLSTVSAFLDPIGRFLGLDGVILLAFILGMPANEIVIPIILLCYLKSGVLSDIGDLAVIREVLLTNGWSLLTALNVTVFSLFHWPCTTTLLTIKKETGSSKITALSFLLPTVIGVTLCIINTLIFKII